MIRRGEPWGLETTWPEDAVIIHSDHALALADPSRPVFLASGDISRSLGHPSMPSGDGKCTEVRIDAMLCTVASSAGERKIVAASSIIVGSHWRHRHMIISNGGWWNEWNIAPRAHPNDGIVELLTLSEKMTMRQRWLAKRKMRTGTHLPHPDISMVRISSATVDRISGEKLLIDGQAVSIWESLSVEVLPDYWRVLV